MATNSERQIGETLTDSLLLDIMTPGYLPDISALQVPQATYSGIILLHEFIHKHFVMRNLISQMYSVWKHEMESELFSLALVFCSYWYLYGECPSKSRLSREIASSFILSTYFVIKNN